MNLDTVPLGSTRPPSMLPPVTTMENLPRVVARTERLSDLIRLSVGLAVGEEPLQWRSRHFPLKRLRDTPERVHGMVENACKDMWGEAADLRMVLLAFGAIGSRL